MVWFSHLLKNFPQFVVIHTVKSFGVVSPTDAAAAAATAAKSLQSCLTLCDPIDGSLPGSPIPGIIHKGVVNSFVAESRLVNRPAQLEWVNSLHSGIYPSFWEIK